MEQISEPNIAILASGSGTTAEAFIHATQTGIVSANVRLVISSKPDTEIFGRVERLNKQYGLGIKILHINGLTHPEGPGQRGEQTLGESAAILEEITKHDIALVALLGYMKKVRGPLLEEYGALSSHKSIFEARMINTHPGPLPATRGLAGLNAQKKVLEMGLENSAQTLHVVSADYDTGATYAEQLVPVMPDDTADSLFAAVQATEKSRLPKDINNFLISQLKWQQGDSPPARIS